MRTDTANPVLISVVIPARNEEQRIGDCLAALEQQSIERQDYEVIVVDNGSTDKTREIVASKNARLLCEPKPSAYHARNLAIQSTNSQWLAFTDADCIPESDWLRNLLATAREHDAWIVGGLTRYDIVNNNLGNRMLVETHQPEQLRATIEIQNGVAGGNMFVCRKAFETFGLFRVMKSGSDCELSQRLAANGHGSSFAENAIVRHQCDLSNWEYLRRSYRIRHGQRSHSDHPTGLSAALFHLKHMPWRPGFRAVGKANHLPGISGRKNFFAEWLYRWANRWATFFGESHAILRSGKKQHEKLVSCTSLQATSTSHENICDADA